MIPAVRYHVPPIVKSCGHSRSQKRPGANNGEWISHVSKSVEVKSPTQPRRIIGPRFSRALTAAYHVPSISVGLGSRQDTMLVAAGSCSYQRGSGWATGLLAALD